ncbi:MULTISPECIES: hypothetical protein [Enterobacteriaceae]|nr:MULTISPECIES: hypothetical protein [Enterobacteriaceae]WMY38169.1 hypothetical protein RHA96_00700 [Citrobacter freundii]
MIIETAPPGAVFFGRKPIRQEETPVDNRKKTAHEVAMLSEKIVTLFSNDALKRFTILEAYAELKRQGTFSVFLSFIDPRTDCLVEGNFQFYPNPVKTYSNMGVCYLTEHLGLTLKIPSSMEWWATHEKSTFHNQDITYLKEGEYVKATIKLEIGSRIRVPNAFEVAPSM